MTSIRESIRRQFSQIKPLEAGIYHYQAPQDDPRNYRLHLRIERNGTGVLIVNASTVLHLNQTAAEYAYYLVQGDEVEEIANKVAARYRVDYQQALQDYSNFLEQIDTLVTLPDLDPVTYLGFDRTRPYTGEISAPYRLDCALTYKLPEGIDPQFAPQERVSQELSTKDWKNIIDKAWDFGIPHIIFTGGEPTLRDDLIELILHAENNGQVTGLMTDGIRLAEEGYLDSLLQTGLDHMLYLFQPKLEGSWETIKSAAESDMYTTMHLTINPQDEHEVDAYLKRFSELGVKSVSLSASTDQLSDALLSARELAANLDLTLEWDIPVPYSAKNPFALEFSGRDRPPGAGHAWLYVEPDGDVLPDQDINQVLGNIVTDSWEKIWPANLE
jgi:organic radical activating enzyme